MLRCLLNCFWIGAAVLLTQIFNSASRSKVPPVSMLKWVMLLLQLMMLKILET